MKQLFKKKYSLKNSASERVSAIAILSNRIGVFLAQYLNRKTTQFRPGTVASILLALCVIGAIAFSILTVYAFKADSFFQIQPVRVPALTRLSVPLPEYDYVLQRIHRFHLYMDSLHSFNSFKYDSILQARPHLMDSITLVENSLITK